MSESMGSDDTKRTEKGRHKSRAAKVRRDWRPAFLKSLEAFPHIVQACRAAGIAKSTAYDEYNRNAEFARQWEESIEISTGSLLGEAFKRARDGWEEVTITDGPDGVITKKVTKVSDGLLSLLLRGYFAEFRNDAKPADENDRAKADPDVARAALDAAAKAAEKGSK